MNISNGDSQGPVYFDIEIPPVSLNFKTTPAQLLTALVPIAITIGFLYLMSR